MKSINPLQAFDFVVKYFDEIFKNGWLMIGLIILAIVGLVLLFK